MKSTLQHLMDQADAIAAVVECEQCSYQQPASVYFERNADVEDEKIHFECPACPADSLLLSRAGTSRVVVVNGLDDLAKLG